MQKLIETIGTKLLTLLSRLPFPVLYAISDVVCFFVHHVLGYRLRVVRTNLRNAFPEKSEKERRAIESRFYHFLCDYAFETLKLLTISKEEIMKRMRFEGVSEVEEIIQEKQFAFVYLGHYCNWEWVSTMPLWYADSATLGAQIYRPLKSKFMDKLFFGLRTRFGAENISKYDTLRRIIALKKEGRCTMVGFISDQSPRWESIHDWVQFLNQDTPVFTGTERIAKKVGAVAYYAQVRRLSRGYYSCRFTKMSHEVESIPDYELTEEYMRMLEADIRRAPEFWLWSHKRWKRQRNADGTPKQDVAY